MVLYLNDHFVNVNVETMSGMGYSARIYEYAGYASTNLWPFRISRLIKSSFGADDKTKIKHQWLSIAEPTDSKLKMDVFLTLCLNRLITDGPLAGSE